VVPSGRGDTGDRGTVSIEVGSWSRIAHKKGIRRIPVPMGNGATDVRLEIGVGDLQTIVHDADHNTLAVPGVPSGGDVRIDPRETARVTGIAEMPLVVTAARGGSEERVVGN